jgi:Uma2 family endonuclease
VGWLSKRTMVVMRTVVLGPRPPELERLIQRRHELGIDVYDEVWEGSYHVAPAPSAAHAYLDNVLAVLLHPYAQAAGLVGTGPFNLGSPDDYRVPDRGYHRVHPVGTWLATAAVVVEIVSPDDETYEKFGFYAAHGVEEILVADPSARVLAVWRRASDGRYEEAASSALLGAGVAELTTLISWPDPTP